VRRLANCVFSIFLSAHCHVQIKGKFLANSRRCQHHRVGLHALNLSRPSATARATRATASSTSVDRASPSRSMLACRVSSFSVSRSISGSCRKVRSALACFSVFASARTSPPTLWMPARSCRGSTSIRESTASVIVAETFSARWVTFDVATRARIAATIISMAVPLINAMSN